MTNRERALNILHYKPIDRMPAVHFGYWRELLQEWADQGKISRDIAENWGDSNEADKELDKLIGWDFNWGGAYGGNHSLLPCFESKVLETLPDGSQIVQSSAGLIERVKPGVVSIPAEHDYLMKDREAFETLYRPKMQFSPERVDYEFYKTFNETRSYDRPIGIAVGSLFGELRSMASVVGMSYLMYDEDEDLIVDIVDTFAQMQYQVVEEILKTGAKFDYGLFWEDICYNGGSLFPPDKLNELCGKHYKKRCDLLHSYGIDIIALDCDGVTADLQEMWVTSGVNTLFPIEVGTWGDQFEPARKRFGKAQLGVGGMDKTTLRVDKEAVDREIARMERLTALGGFLPCPDHRLMPGTKFELVQYYAEEIKKIRV